MADNCPTEHELQGRLRPLDGKTVRLFGSIADPATAAGFLEPDRSVAQWQPRGCGCGLWMLQSSVVEVLRNSEEGVGLSPLDFAVFGLNNPVPAGAARAFGRAQVKMRISAEASTICRQWVQDVGQSIEINADCVCVEYFAPSNFYEVAPTTTQQAAQPTRTGLVTDVQLSASLNRLEQSVGCTEVILTTHALVPADEQLAIVVPSFARDVTIYQTAAGAASGLWTQWYGDPTVVTGSVQAGVLPWIAGSRRTEQESVIPDVSHLLTDLDNVERFFTLRWLIRP